MLFQTLDALAHRAVGTCISSAACVKFKCRAARFGRTRNRLERRKVARQRNDSRTNR